MPLSLQYLFLLIAAGAVLLPRPGRRLALVGLVPLGLSLAATSVRLGESLSGLALRAAEQGAPLRFLQINTGLALLGAGLVITGVTWALVRGRVHRAPTVRAIAAALLVAGGIAPLVAAHSPLLQYIGWLPVVGAALAVGAGAATLYLVGRFSRISRVFAWVDRRLLERSQPDGMPVLRLRTILGWSGALALLWVRLKSPDPLDIWAPVLMPLVLLSMWHVAVVPGDGITRWRRLLEMLLALAFFGILAGAQGVAGAVWLLGSAVGVPWGTRILQQPIGRLLYLPMAWGAFLVVTGGLTSQVTYTVLAAAGIAAALWVYHTPE